MLACSFQLVGSTRGPPRLAQHNEFSVVRSHGARREREITFQELGLVKLDTEDSVAAGQPLGPAATP